MKNAFISKISFRPRDIRILLLFSSFFPCQTLHLQMIEDKCQNPWGQNMSKQKFKSIFCWISSEVIEI